MRRSLALIIVVLGWSSLLSPVAAQDKAPPTDNDAVIIASTERAIAGFSCAPVDGEAATDVTLPSASSESGTHIVARERVNFRCTYGNSRRSIEVGYEVDGDRPGRVCTPYDGRYESASQILTGRLVEGLAVSADIKFFSDDPATTKASMEAAAASMAAQLAPFAATCPTPLDLPPVDENVEPALDLIDQAISEHCANLPASVTSEFPSSTFARSITVRADSLAVVDNEPFRQLQERVFIDCKWGSIGFETTVVVAPAFSYQVDSWADGVVDQCSAPTQLVPPAALSVTVNSTDEMLDVINTRATGLARALAPLAVDCEVEFARLETLAAERTAGPDGAVAECPAVSEMEFSFAEEFDGSRHIATMWSGIPRVYPGIDGSCAWELTEEIDGINVSTALRLKLSVLPPGQPEGDLAKVCATRDIDDGDNDFGRITSPDLAAFVDITVRNARRDTYELGQRAAAEFLATNQHLADSCAGVPDLSIEALLTPLPDYLATGLEAGANGQFAVAAISAPSDSTPASSETADSVAQPAAAPASAVDTSEPWYALPLRIARLAMLIVSILALILAFIAIRQPSRIRPVMERLRVAFTLGGAIIMYLVLSIGAPIWALALALVAGSILGLVQGQNLVVTLKEKGLYAQRSGLAIAAFAAGLILTQVAGLLNRTGAISLGLALSFLSAATTVGLIFGRRSPAASARAAGTVATVLIVLMIASPALTRTSSAQDESVEPADPGVEALNAAVDWADVSLSAGLTVVPINISIEPGLAIPPASITRQLIDAPMGGVLTSFTGSETFSFALDATGVCCDVLYAVEGIKTSVELDGWVSASKYSLAEPSTIGAVRAYGAEDFFGPSDILFGDTGPVNGACGRPVSQFAQDVSIETPIGLIDGEERSISARRPEFHAKCEMDLGLDGASEITAAPPAADAAERQRDGRACPVNQEVIDAFGAASALEGVNTNTLKKRYVQPNAPACSNFDLAFGNEAPGGTRNEVTYYLKPGPEGDQAVFAQDSDEYLNFLPRNEQIDVVCDVNTAGLPLDSTGEECEYTSFHALPNDGTATIHTDYTTADGPNVYVRAVFPTGIFRYRCHHCEPGDPRIADFVQSATALAQFGPDGGGSASDLSDAADQVDAEDRAEGSASGEDSDGPTNEEAAWAGLAGLLAALGISATALAEAGIKPEDILSQLTARERAAALGEENPFPDEIVGHDGEMLPVDDNGMVEYWDNDLQEFQRSPVAEAERTLTIQRGDHGIYDHGLGRTIYLGSAEEADAYAQRVSDQFSADIRDRAEADWEQRRPEWIRQQEAGMRADRQAIEQFEEARARHVQRVNDGLARIGESDVMADIVSARGGGSFQDLEDIYYDWLDGQVGEGQAEFAQARREAALARVGELTARAAGSAARAGLTVAGGPLGVAYTAAGLAVISGTEEGYQAYMDGKEVGEVIARTGFGIVLGVRDAATGRFGQMPRVPGVASGYVSSVGDYSEAYVRARMDGQTHEQAQRAAEIAYASSVASEVVGAGFDVLPPGAMRELAQLGTTMVIGGTTSAASGGDFLDGALDAGAGFVGGRAGSQVATDVSGRSVDLSPDQRILDQLAANSADRSRVIPLEEQGPSIQAAAAARETIEPPARIVHGVDENGQPTTRLERPLGNRTIEVSDPRTVLEGLTQTTDSRTGKQAPQDIQDVVINTRAELIYAEPNNRTITTAMADPRVQGMLQPGDNVEFHTFSTPGKPPSLGADRDARMVISRPDPNAPGGRVLIEIPLDYYEQNAYTDFADHARDLYGGRENIPDHVQAEVDQRIPRIIAELEAHQAADPTAPQWTSQQIEDRALAETHNQLYTDKGHDEASIANTDQGTAFRSVANNRTVDDVVPTLRDQGLVRDGDVVTMVDTDRGPQMVVTSVAGDQLEIPSSMWRDQLASNQNQYGDQTEQVPTNVTAEALAAQRAQGTLSDPTDYARMWTTKSEFYAGLNEPEAVAQSQKGIGELVAIREGYRKPPDSLAVPPIGKQDQAAIDVVLSAQVGVGAASDGTVEAKLQAIYGPETTLAEALGRIAMLNEGLNHAYVDPNPPTVGSISTGSLIRGATSPGSTTLPDEERP